MMTSPSVSLQTLLPAPAGVPLVFLVPSAGAGPGSFRSWRRLPAGDVHVVAVLAPGREGRLKERPFDDVAALAASVATAMATSITERPDAPFAVMGHSLGAVVAREALIRMDHVPRVFMAAAALPPHLLPDHGDPTDDDLIHLLERFGGTPVDILRDREFAGVAGRPGGDGVGTARSSRTVAPLSDHRRGRRFRPDGVGLPGRGMGSMDGGRNVTPDVRG